MYSDDIVNIIYDPISLQSKILSDLESKLEYGMEFPDPNNPFTFLLENSIMLTTASMNEVAANMRKMYPILANTKEDLYHHIGNNELEDIFASPNKCMFTIYVNKKEFINNSYVTDSYRILTIPHNTTFTVNDITFTLFNDIDIIMYGSGKFIVKSNGSDRVLAVPFNNILNSGTLTDNNGVEWIIFDVELQQVNIIPFSDTILTSAPYVKTVNITDQYVTMEAYTTVNNVDLSPLNITYSKFVYDINKPALYVVPSNDKLMLNIPLVYIKNGLVSGNLLANIYTTKGELSLPLYEYNLNDVKIKYNTQMITLPSVSPINSIPIYAKPTSFTYGGRNEIDFETLKAKIINYTTGDNILPITSEEIVEKANTYGFTIEKSLDTVLKREYIARIEIDDLGYDINATADIIMHPLKFLINDIDNDLIKNTDKGIIIKPYTVYKLSDNTISILSRDEIENINIDNVNDEKYFYTPFKYILEYNKQLNVRAYDTTFLYIDNIRNNVINDKLDTILNITDRTISRNGDDYIIEAIIENGSELLSKGLEHYKAAISINIDNSDSKAYYIGEIYQDTYGVVKLKVTINTTGYIDEYDNIIFDNFLSIFTYVSAPLKSTYTIYIYSTNELDSIGKNNIQEDIPDDELTAILYKEDVDITLATRLEYLYTNYDIDYTDRKYKTYEEDVYLTYEEDVYKTDEYGIVFEYKDEDGDGEAETAYPILLHNKGDIVYDDDGNPIIKHHKGDVMLDEYGDPIIDDNVGIEHTVDLLLLEYKFKLAVRDDYVAYITALLKKIIDISTKELEELNKNLLDNTVIKYKPKDNLFPVKLYINNVVKTMNNFISPTVNIYISNDSGNDVIDYINNNEIQIKRKIQYMLKDPNNRLKDIEDYIQQYLGDDILSVKITDIDPFGNLDKRSYTPDSSLLIIDKKLELDKNGFQIVNSNIEFNIIKI